MPYAVSIDLYQQIETQLGKELATSVSKAIELGIAQMQEEAKLLAVQKKVELKEELTKEPVTKVEFLGEMKTLREEVKSMEGRLQGETKVLREEMKTLRVEPDRKFTSLFLLLFFTTVFVNKETLSFFLRVIGVLK